MKKKKMDKDGRRMKKRINWKISSIKGELKKWKLKMKSINKMNQLKKVVNILNHKKQFKRKLYQLRDLQS